MTSKTFYINLWGIEPCSKIQGFFETSYKFREKEKVKQKKD